MRRKRLDAGRDIDGNVVAFQSGGVVRVPGFGVAEFAPEAAVRFAGEWLAAGAFVGPGIVCWRRTGWARGVGEPAAAEVRLRSLGERIRIH